MQTVYFETNEQKKLAAIQGMVEALGLQVTIEKLPVLQGPSFIPSTEARLGDIAVARAKAIYERVRRPIMVEESGYYIPALNDFPGACTHYVLHTVGLGGIMQLMRQHQDRRCIWRSVVAYVDENRKLTVFEGEDQLGWLGDVYNEDGSAATAPSFTADEERPNPLWEVFIPENYDQALATLPPTKLIQYFLSKQYQMAMGRFIGAALQQQELPPLTKQRENTPTMTL